MKRTYVKLSSEILMVETESSFMGASVRLETSVTVKDYEVYKDWGTTADTGYDSVVDDAFNVTFD